MIDLVSDMTVRHELIGLEALISPFSQHISSQRSSMYASNLPQALVCNGNEPPMIMAGMEAKVGKYDFNKTHRKNDVQIIKVIPKLRTHAGAERINSNPSFTIVYRDTVTGEVDFFDIDKYTPLYDGFGYINKHMNRAILREGNLLSADTQVCSAPNHDGDLYSLGLNANVAFFSAWGVADDAFVISSSLAKRAEHFAIHKIKVSLNEDDTPLNLYGTADEYRIMPDIDEMVNTNGIIMGVREMHPDTFMADTTMEALSSPEYLSDELYIAEAGAQVLDVQVYCSSKAFRQLEQQPGPYAQLLKYQRRHYEYYESVIQVYNEQMKHSKIGTKLSNLVFTAMQLRHNKYADDAKRNIKLVDKRDEIDFITVEITFGFTRKIGPGSKFTGRDGAKGVVSAIWPDADMPVDEQGIRADIIISPESVFNRMNPGQMYEQFFNRASVLIQQRLLRGELGNNQQAFRYILNYITDVRPLFGNFVASRVKTQEDIDEFVYETRSRGITLVIPPFCKEISPEKVLFISEKYDVGESPVTYYFTNYAGEREAVTTKVPVMVGPKYLLLLGKIPLSMMSAIQYGHVNQFGTPAKPEKKSIKAQSLFGLTPIRYGEDEQCMLTMALGPETVNRFVSLTANSPKALSKLTSTLLTAPRPSAIQHIDMTDSEMRDSNITIGVLSHMLGAIGYDTTRD